uniref:Polyhomeotic-proximal chromatin protein n=1 Tax=Dugesia japonica TaxID=6161 RepID=A0A5J6BTH3_DUGJA|nr:polyhomeotic-proximal chromatin protein [Dugesia japonica]
MENYTEMSLYSSDSNKMQPETNGEISKSYKENDKDNIKPLSNENNIPVNQVMTSSCAITSTINSVKPVSADGFQINSQSNIENGKLIRRNNVQPNLQPLLKKPLNNISTTKPLILPAPISDSYSQGTKTNIVTMHSNYVTSTVSSQFNNCPQQMAMGIIQPQHFGYSGISNNRYPYGYSTQQLTLSNGGIGTAVQLMPVMNQNNNQINNSRMQSLPLFMTPIIGAPSGMLFQPIMSQSNPLQTINLPNSTYSNDYSQGIALQSQPMYTSGIRNTTVITNDYENILKQDVEPNKATVIPTQIVEKSETIINSKINKTQTDIEHTGLIRSNIKHRELIRTQIYRMKPAVEELPPERRTAILVDPPVTPPIDPPLISLPEIAPSENNQIQIDIVNNDEAEDLDQPQDQTTTVVCQEIESTSPVITISDPQVPVVVVPPNEPESISNGHIEIKSNTPISLPIKRKLPSPEILNEFENPKKLFKKSSFDEKLDSGPKSPGSLFEKLYKDIPERQTSLFSQNNRHSNKLTAVVRPKQRKILVHYLDDLIVFESDEPFPTSNKMQVVKSALRAGNIKLNSQKSKLFTDHFLYANTDDEMSPNQQKILKTNFNVMVNTKTDSCLEPLSIDIPTTNTTSSCDSVDSSQVRPLSVCSHRSPTPVPLPVKKVIKDRQSPKKEIIQLSSPIKEDKVKLMPPLPSLQESKVHTIEKSEHINVLNNTTNKNPSPVKQVSPVKLKPQKSGLDRPICEWSVNDVADFVKQTPGCDNYVAMFINHEIDGEALLLLSNENLIQGALNMKIGPALKLCARIEKRKALDPPQH